MNYSKFGSAGNGSTTNFFSASNGVCGVNVSGNTIFTNSRCTTSNKKKMSDESSNFNFADVQSNDVIELHIHSPDTFDWSKLSKHNVNVVVVNGNVQGNVSATNVTAQNINGDIKESVNVTVSGNLNGNIKNAVNVTRR